MNSTQYAFAKYLKIFGINKKQTRMNAAAHELQLLREGEYLLGTTLWEDCEDYEPVERPYWHLRKLKNKNLELEKEIHELSENLAQTQQQQKAVVEHPSSQQELPGNTKEAERVQLLTEAENLTIEKESIAKKAQLCKQQHESLKLKINVFREENASESLIESQIQKGANIKEEFKSLKQQNDLVDTQLLEIEGKIDALEEMIADERNQFKNEATETLDDIGKANKKLSNLRSEVGRVQSQMHQHHSELGNIICSFYKGDSQCRALAKQQKQLISILTSLRLSIERNNAIADRH